MDNKGGFENPSKNPEDQPTGFLDREILAVENRYDRFSRNPQIKRMDLFAGDFIPVSSKPKKGEFNMLQIVIPSSDSPTPVNYEDIYGRLIRVFASDMMLHEVTVVRGKEIPEGETRRLKQFIATNPRQELNYSCRVYRINIGTVEERRIEVKRYYSDPEMIYSLSEIWTALRSRRY